MPRAYRHSFPGEVLHITHRCQSRQWLPKFYKDRLRRVHWRFKARQRFDLCILNYRALLWLPRTDKSTITPKQLEHDYIVPTV